MPTGVVCSGGVVHVMGYDSRAISAVQTPCWSLLASSVCPAVQTTSAAAAIVGLFRFSSENSYCPNSETCFSLVQVVATFRRQRGLSKSVAGVVHEKSGRFYGLHAMYFVRCRYVQEKYGISL